MGKIGKDICIASEKIISGELVVFPTETVYGIGADATNKNAVEKIFAAKNRPADNPLIVHISSIEMLNNIVESVGDIEKRLIEKFWPGPLSIIFPKKDLIPNVVSAGLNTVAVRMPDNKEALELIKLSNVPIAAPSANISTRPSGTCIEDIYDELKDSISYFIDGGHSIVGIESTVVKVSNDIVNILRPGKISKEDILEITDKVVLDKGCLQKVDKEEKVLSPGMKHKHYAPSTKCITLYFDEITNIKELIKNKEKRISFILTSKNAKKLNLNDNINIIDVGDDLEDISRNLFSSLRQIDKYNSDICYIQNFDLNGIGTGIMNRVNRACNYDKIYI